MAPTSFMKRRRFQKQTMSRPVCHVWKFNNLISKINQSVLSSFHAYQHHQHADIRNLISVVCTSLSCKFLDDLRSSANSEVASYTMFFLMQMQETKHSPTITNCLQIHRLKPPSPTAYRYIA